MQNNVTTLTGNRLIASAARTREVPGLLGNADAAVTFGAVVAACGRPQATMHRMLATLVNTAPSPMSLPAGVPTPPDRVRKPELER